jgi:hypothetical protein
MTRFAARCRRRAGLLLITAVGIVLGSPLPRIQAGATVPTARAGQVLAAVASGSWVWRLRRGEDRGVGPRHQASGAEVLTRPLEPAAEVRQGGVARAPSTLVHSEA